MEHIFLLRSCDTFRNDVGCSRSSELLPGPCSIAVGKLTFYEVLLQVIIDVWFRLWPVCLAVGPSVLIIQSWFPRHRRRHYRVNLQQTLRKYL